MPFVGDAHVAVKQIGEQDWELLAPLTYEGAWETFVVPAGQRTDFASIPRYFVWFLPRYGRYTRAAILHDYLWRELATTGRMRWVDADGIFRRAMRELDVSFLHRWLMWSAVRLAAITKPRGREGWHEGLWAAVLLTVLCLPIVLPPMVVIVAALLAFELLESLVYVVLKIHDVLRRPGRRPERRKSVVAPKVEMTL